MRLERLVRYAMPSTRGLPSPAWCLWPTAGRSRRFVVQQRFDQDGVVGKTAFLADEDLVAFGEPESGRHGVRLVVVRCHHPAIDRTAVVITAPTRGSSACRVLPTRNRAQGPNCSGMDRFVDFTILRFGFRIPPRSVVGRT